MTVGSVFSGIGGFDLGLERSGHVIQWQVESNAYCRSVLRRHWPHVKRYEDAVTVDTCSLARVDCICAGWPCQPVSVAGLRKGVDDVDWLWPSVVRVVSDLRPRVVLLENTAGLFTANDGRAFGQVLGDLAEIRYDCEWSVLSARTLGAPHRRERVFIVGIMADTNSERSQGLRSNVLDKRVAQGSTERKTGWSCSATGTRFFAGIVEKQEWCTQSSIPRVVDGLPDRVERTRAIGNAVVPQVAEWIGNRLAILGI